MANMNDAFRRAMTLAAVTGLKAALGPALVASARRRPERQNLAMAALAEMVLDKLPILPSRSSLPMIVPRALAGAWVAQTMLGEDGKNDPWAPLLGAATAAGVARFAPMVRATLRRVFGVPDFVIGIAEDYLALRLGSEAAGLSMNDVKAIATESVDEMAGHFRHEAHSVGAGSM
ncbi:MAG TPA: hypothetical protein VGZ22_06030 [Isosphaeraceae bacterium]|jgi:hypothetical protein|nr:hypothetical protein [Isosphaeraceae bacterium]